MLLDGHFCVVSASMSFCRAFGLDPARVTGRQIFALGEGEWDAPQLRSLLDTTLAGANELDAFEMDLEQKDRPSRRLVLSAKNLAYDDAANIRLLLAVSDVTDARLSDKLKDDLLREKAILLQELQHRVANSLQIIASVLLQSARRVQSEEARGHLYDAHQRVMSVSAVQQQLAATRLGDVELRTHFDDLCRSIGDSMIRDRKQIHLNVSVDDSVTSAGVSVSLGLVVTELVINALKHAFPGGRDGEIVVDYRAEGAGWRLSVRDNGVGVPRDPASAKPGLGTSIIEALARQLEARVQISAANPGTMVSIVHG